VSGILDHHLHYAGNRVGDQISRGETVVSAENREFLAEGL
jgi:hypothetical protein